MTEAVAGQVLKDNYEQSETLRLAEHQAGSMLHVHAPFLATLQPAQGLDRAPEALPSDQEPADPSGDQRGPPRPELPTLIAYSRLDLYRDLLDSDGPEAPSLAAELEASFPAPLPGRFVERMRDPRLRREITATQVLNNVLHG